MLKCRCALGLGLRTFSPSSGGRLYGDEYFIPAYVGHVTDRTHPDISPLFGDLRDLTPTLLVVGASDILLEDNLALAARLCVAGNDLDVRVYPESVHGFTSSPTTMAAKAIEHVGAWLTKRLGQDWTGGVAGIPGLDSSRAHSLPDRCLDAVAGRQVSRRRVLFAR
ncbi:alpha/beta hydrolase fold domain-containing protein [Nocardia otitidiscaviarum]|uniref:alpha/beta hydrolase fold domain-containing protein n=1 Tax=Nocardia otitidiscaviarum TaxID=1823 RepID=UPI003CC833AE